MTTNTTTRCLWSLTPSGWDWWHNWQLTHSTAGSGPGTACTICWGCGAGICAALCYFVCSVVRPKCMCPCRVCVLT